ncbi:hypothetical protein A4A49_50219 [Nicotiana attenuata]|uniref:Uncharacterized protein n=1 Tax=Nicotiana attenuata TaxID=49451 RepID=A0A1J6KAL9_NICAT|nr:hypothetical protein A4A49_50219 [Nicotiana attenuata]
MVVDGQQRQLSTNHRPTSPKQSHTPEFPITPLLPGSDEGGPSSNTSFRSNQLPTKPHDPESKESNFLTTTTEHPSRNHHSTGDFQEERCYRGSRGELPSNKNIIDNARLREVDRVQHRSEWSNSGLVPQNDVQMWNELSLSPNTRSAEATIELNPYLESEKEVSTPSSAQPARPIEPS